MRSFRFSTWLCRFLLAFLIVGAVIPTASSAAPHNQLVLYVAKYCSHCRRAEHYLLERGVRFEIRDISQSSQFHREWKEQYRGDIVPLLVLDNGRAMLDGFQRQNYDLFLKQHSISTRN